MTEKAILSRLRQVDKLRELCLALMKAKKVQKISLRNSDDNSAETKELTNTVKK